MISIDLNDTHKYDIQKPSETKYVTSGSYSHRSCRPASQPYCAPRVTRELDARPSPIVDKLLDRPACHDDGQEEVPSSDYTKVHHGD